MNKQKAAIREECELKAINEFRMKFPRCKPQNYVDMLCRMANKIEADFWINDFYKRIDLNG